MLATACVWRLEDNFAELVLSFHLHMGLRGHQAGVLSGKIPSIFRAGQGCAKAACLPVQAQDFCELPGQHHASPSWPKQPLFTVGLAPGGMPAGQPRKTILRSRAHGAPSPTLRCFVRVS